MEINNFQFAKANLKNNFTTKYVAFIIFNPFKNAMQFTYITTLEYQRLPIIKKRIKSALTKWGQVLITKQESFAKQWTTPSTKKL